MQLIKTFKLLLIIIQLFTCIETPCSELTYSKLKCDLKEEDCNKFQVYTTNCTVTDNYTRCTV